MSEEQLAFDIEGMLHEAALESTPEWRGAPLHFTTVYYQPAGPDLDDGDVRRRNVGFDVRLVPHVFRPDRVAPLLDSCQVGLGKRHRCNAIEGTVVRPEHLSE